MNEQNIIPHQFTSEQNREQAAINGRKGGIARQKKKRQQKDLAELLNMFMSFKVKSPEAIAQLQSLGFTEEECTNRAAFMMNMQKHALKGNSAFAKMVVEIEEQAKTRDAELKRIKLENKKLEQEVEQLKIRNEQMRAARDQKNDVEDLTPLATLLQDEEDEAEIEREVEEDGY